MLDWLNHLSFFGLGVAIASIMAVIIYAEADGHASFWGLNLTLLSMWLYIFALGELVSWCVWYLSEGGV